MSLKDKVREAFQGEKKIISKWDSDTTPNIYNLDIFLRKSKYRLVEIIAQTKNGRIYPELILEPIEEDHLHPEIHHSVDENEFYINVKKYGELVSSDVREIIKGYEIALSIVDHLANSER